MDFNEVANLDIEFKRYLEILRPYLNQVHQNVREICEAWIHRLTNCDDLEKSLRNKYIFAMCYQLAKGIIEEPFLTCPPRDKLQQISEINSTISSATDLECVVVDLDANITKSDASKKTMTDMDFEFRANFNSDYDDDDEKTVKVCPSNLNNKNNVIHEEPAEFYGYGNIDNSRQLVIQSGDQRPEVEFRATNVIMKLREIKKQNMLLHEELHALKEESNSKIYKNINLHKTNLFEIDQNSDNIEDLQQKLKEVYEMKNSLLDTINNLQQQLDQFEESKQEEIDEIISNHKLEIIKIKSTVRLDVKKSFDKNLEDLKKFYDASIVKLQQESENNIREMTSAKDFTINEKENEIKSLQKQVDDLRRDLKSSTMKLDRNCESYSDTESYKDKVQNLEKKLLKLEKTKNKYVREFEAKLSCLQREKHLSECSLQLQLVRQRAQFVNDSVDESQSQVMNSLDKLEQKYKDIVGNIQTTAIQRRIQDQIALESILQAACGQIENENIQRNTIPNNRFTPTTTRALLHDIKAYNLVGDATNNKSFGDESVMAGFCLEGDRFGELFERVYIPQRDTGDGPRQ